MRFLNNLDGDLISKWGVRLILLVGAIILVIVLNKESKEKREVYNNRAYTVGIITEYSLLARSGGYFVEYVYEVKGSTYKVSNINDGIRCKNCIGKKYRVIYSKKNPKKSFLLATEKIFKDFNIQLPKKMEVE